MELVITIVNVKNKQCRFIFTKHPEQISEIEDCLDENEIMFVNEIEN